MKKTTIGTDIVNTFKWMESSWKLVDSDSIGSEGDGHWFFYGFCEFFTSDGTEEIGEVIYEEVGKPDGVLYAPVHSADAEWIARHAEDVAELGFTIVYHDGEFWGLGIDFTQASSCRAIQNHMLPLYQLRKEGWHESPARSKAA